MRDTLSAEDLIDQLYAIALEPDEFLEEFSQSESGVTYTRLTSSFAQSVLKLILKLAIKDAEKYKSNPEEAAENVISSLEEVIKQYRYQNPK